MHMDSSCVLPGKSHDPCRNVAALAVRSLYRALEFGGVFLSRLDRAMLADDCPDGIVFDRVERVDEGYHIQFCFCRTFHPVRGCNDLRYALTNATTRLDCQLR